MGNKPDMSLSVSVVVTGTLDNSGNLAVSAQYAQTASVPVSSGVVDPGGDINLKNMAYNGNEYSKDTDITFNLSGQITNPQGGAVNFNFPSNPAEAVTIRKHGGGSTEKLVPRSGNGAMQIIIDDENNDNANYTYCLNLWALTDPPNGQFAQLDPNIVNR